MVAAAHLRTLDLVLFVFRKVQDGFERFLAIVPFSGLIPAPKRGGNVFSDDDRAVG
jgi:hypothetical protein